MGIHGGYKDIYSTFISLVSEETIKAGVERWLRLGEEHALAEPTKVIWGRFSTTKLDELEETHEARDKFLGIRGRGTFANIVLGVLHRMREKCWIDSTTNIWQLPDGMTRGHP